MAAAEKEKRPWYPAPPGLAVAAEVWRSGRVESVHLGAAAVADAGGRLLAAAGDPHLATYLRSAAKPVQLAVMWELGLPQVGPLQGPELAICAASHGGEPGHVAVVAALLARHGLGVADLRCGPAEPLDERAARALWRSGRAPSPLHNNCSGKHAAMLLTCLANGWPLEDYEVHRHPLQEGICRGVEAFAGQRPEVGVDGCGVPTFYLPLRAAACMTARLMEAAEEEDGARAVVAAMAAHPWHTSGSCRLAYRLMRAAPGLLAKEGAEGFFVVGIPARRSPWGRAVALAVKVLDGAGEAARGREPAVVAALLALRVLSPREGEALRPLAAPPVVNARGEAVGEVRGVLQLGAWAG